MPDASVNLAIASSYLPSLLNATPSSNTAFRAAALAASSLVAPVDAPSLNSSFCGSPRRTRTGNDSEPRPSNDAVTL